MDSVLNQLHLTCGVSPVDLAHHLHNGSDKLPKFCTHLLQTTQEEETTLHSVNCYVNTNLCLSFY